MEIATFVNACLSLAAALCIGFLAYGGWLVVRYAPIMDLRAGREKRGPSGMPRLKYPDPETFPDARRTAAEWTPPGAREKATAFCFSVAFAGGAFLLLALTSSGAPPVPTAAAASNRGPAATEVAAAAKNAAAGNDAESPGPAFHAVR